MRQATTLAKECTPQAQHRAQRHSNMRNVNARDTISYPKARKLHRQSCQASSRKRLTSAEDTVVRLNRNKTKRNVMRVVDVVKW